MKSVCLLLPLFFALAGCVTDGSFQAGSQGDVSAAGMAAAAPIADTAPVFPPPPDFSPHLIQPVTGGAPVLGLPLGGSLYQPVTGGMPVTGIMLGP